MKRAVLTLLVILILPLIARANSFDPSILTGFGWQSGTIVSPDGKSLLMTTNLTSVSSGRAVVTGTLGTVTLSLQLLKGSLATHAGLRGTMTITTNGSAGLPNDVVFTGDTFGFWLALSS